MILLDRFRCTRSIALHMIKCTAHALSCAAHALTHSETRGIPKPGFKKTISMSKIDPTCTIEIDIGNNAHIRKDRYP